MQLRSVLSRVRPSDRRRALVGVAGAAATTAVVLALAMTPAALTTADPAATEVVASGVTLGSPDLQSIGPITFAPDGTLFLGDNLGSSVFAVQTDSAAGEAHDAVAIDGVEQRVASLLGTGAGSVRIHDMAVHPRSHDVYLSVSRGGDVDGYSSVKGLMSAERTPHLIRMDAAGDMQEVLLDEVYFSKVTFTDVRGPGTRRGSDTRSWNILEIAWSDDGLWVSGMSNEEWSSRIRRVSYPFESAVDATGLRIFHTAHGRYETGAPARVFVPYEREGAKHLFAGFSCTPLVEFDVAEILGADEAHGRTIAELGAGNHVLDMISVQRDRHTYFVLANHLHDSMVLALDDFDGADNLTRPTNGAGIDRSPIGGRKIKRLANYGPDRVLLLQEGAHGLDLTSVTVESLIGD